MTGTATTWAAVSEQPGETRAAVLDDDRLLDLLVERADRPEIVGNTYLGRVTAYDRALEAAFVDIGLAQPGFLPRKAMRRRLHEGDSVAVAVVRAPGGGKGAKLTARIEPTAAGQPPHLLSQNDALAHFLRRHAPACIRIGRTAELSALRQRMPELAERFAVDHTTTDPFHAAGLEAELDALLAPEVPLPGGGLLRIEPVHTLTAVDVDAAGRSAPGGGAGLAREVNTAAARELARQIRLRSLSGLIVVDFLEMASKGARREVTELLAAALAGDPAEASVAPMRSSGLVEIARQRLRRPLHEVLTEPGGPYGAGWRRTAAAVAFDLLRAADREILARPRAALSAMAAPEVVAALDTGPAQAARAALETRLGGPLALRAEADRTRECYEIRTG